MTRKSDEGPSRHLIVFVQRWMVRLWKEIAFHYGPIYYGESDKQLFLYGSEDMGWFEAFARPKNVLWIVSTYPGFPPSLVARFEIETRLDECPKQSHSVPEEALDYFDYSYLIQGSPERSRFLGHNDFTPALLKLTLDRKNIEPAPVRSGRSQKWQNSYGSLFQRPRLVNGGEHHLEQHYKSLLKRTVFLSWKHRGLWSKRPDIRRFCRELARHGYAVWWDLLALPPARSAANIKDDADEEFDADELLDRILRNGLAQSRALVAVTSEKYGTASKIKNVEQVNWTQREWEGTAVSEGRRSRRRAAYLLGGPPGEESKVSLGRAQTIRGHLSPQAAALRFKRWFK